MRRFQDIWFQTNNSYDGKKFVTCQAEAVLNQILSLLSDSTFLCIFLELETLSGFIIKLKEKESTQESDSTIFK